jgi:hypothetical protein
MAIQSARIKTETHSGGVVFGWMAILNILIVNHAKYVERLEAKAMVTARNAAKMIINHIRSRAEERWLSMYSRRTRILARWELDEAIQRNTMSENSALGRTEFGNRKAL